MFRWSKKVWITLTSFFIIVVVVVVLNGTGKFALDALDAGDPLKPWVSLVIVSPTNNDKGGPNKLARLEVSYLHSEPYRCPLGWDAKLSMPFYKKAVADSVVRTNIPLRTITRGVHKDKNKDYPGAWLYGYDVRYSIRTSIDGNSKYAKVIERIEKIRKFPATSYGTNTYFVHGFFYHHDDSYFLESKIIGKLDTGKSLDVSKLEELLICEKPTPDSLED